MLARRYNRVVEIWQNTNQSDGFGGNMVTSSKLANSWCNIKTISPTRFTDLGITDFDYAIEVNLRHRKDLDYFQKGLFFKYKGQEYVFNSIVENDLDNVEIQIIGVRNE